MKHAFCNHLRYPFEGIVGIVAILIAILCLSDPGLLSLSPPFAMGLSLMVLGFGLWRFKQGWQLWHWQCHLSKPLILVREHHEIPTDSKHLYLGEGFTWQAHHRQQLHLLGLIAYQRHAKQQEDGHQLGGKPWLHNIGLPQEQAIVLNQSHRHSHLCVFGMTRVGKSRFLALNVHQDIVNGEAVLIIDPKGDLSIAQDLWVSAKQAGRLQDIKMCHLGFPEVSAKYNPLQAFATISEVADRITASMEGGGDSQVFKDFAWQYINLVAQVIHKLPITLNYHSIAFYVRDLKALLVQYMNQVFAKANPEFTQDIKQRIADSEHQLDLKGRPLPPLTQTEAIWQYMAEYVNDPKIKDRDTLATQLYQAASLDPSYYDKITASVRPVLDKINQTPASDLFSWQGKPHIGVIRFAELIKRKKIVYMGLDSLTNQSMAEGVGKALLADLVSLCGRLYHSNKSHSLCLHCDEFSNVVQNSFINLLNKAGGAGIKVTAYTQTINDLGAAFSGNPDKAKMLMGNFGSLVMMRIANQDTAECFTQCLPETMVRTLTPHSQITDQQHATGYTTSNSDSIHEQTQPLITTNDLFSLPKGHAFVLSQGGQLNKIRLPLLKRHNDIPPDFPTLMASVNIQQKTKTTP